LAQGLTSIPAGLPGAFCLYLSREITIKAGAKYVTDVNKAEFVGVMKPVRDKFSPTPEMKALLQEILNTK
jgi:hypothetical protein